MSNAIEVHEVDEVLPWSRMIPVSLQHVLVMYAGAIAVPLIVGGAFKLPPTQLAFLVNADLFSCGVVTLIQCIGFWKFGIRLPVIMGVTFAAVGPMVAMANAGQSLLAIYGAVISSGVFGILIAPVFGRLIRFFPPLVTGTVITVIGVSLLEVGVNWAGGGFGAKDFGAPQNLMIVAIVLGAILLINKLTTGFLANIAVLSGLVIGYGVAVLLGLVSFADIDKAQWFGLVLPFRFGFPQFEIGSIVSFCLVMIVTLTESTGMFLALGEVCNRPIDHVSLVRGLRTDGLGTVIGGLFNTFPYTSFSQNVGLVGMTGIRSRWAVAGSGVILIVFGLFPKMGAVVASIPQAVLGGAGLCMFGMVAATGIKILQRVDFEHRANLLTVAVSLGMGVIPMIAPNFFHALPSWAAPFTHSGITLAALTAVVLNALFNHVGSTAEVERELAKSAHDAGTE